MTSSAASAWPESTGLNARWGHYAPHLLIASVGAVIAMGFEPIAVSAQLFASLGLLMFVLATWVMLRAHDRSMCEKCISAMPLNPSEQAAGYRRRFWMSHTGAEPRFLLPYLAVLIGSNFATGTFTGRIGWAVVQSSMMYLILSYATHRRLQPWCPWCSDGGGGSEHEVTPDPISPDSRSLV